MRGFGRRGRAALCAVALVAAPASAVLLTATAAGAVTVTVDNTGDPAVGNPANCPAVPAGTCTLRDAIAATDTGAADTVSITVGPISLSQGVLLHTMPTALTIEGNGNSVVQTTAASLLLTFGPLTVDGLVASAPTNMLNAFGPVSVSGSTLTATTGTGVVSFGGGTSLTVTGSTISSPAVAANAAQDVTVTDSTVSSSAGPGVVAAAGNAVVDSSSVTGAAGGVGAGTNATVTASEITSSGGQAVLAGVGGRASVDGSVVNGQGGGVQAGLEVTITGSTITSGGGLGAFVTSGTVTAESSSISGGNLAVGANTGVVATNTELTGGASVGVVTNNGTVTLTGSTVTGGAMFGVKAPAGVDAVNSTISGNSGCGLLSPNGHVTLVYATVAENGAGGCGSNVSAATLESFASVVALQSPNCVVGTTVSHGFNRSDDATCGFTDPTDQTGANPLLGALADNGGPTLTRATQVTSPLIDAIPTAQCSADGASTVVPLVDQRGDTRPSGGGCDIGAVELQAAVTTPAVILTPRFTG
ncbi:MAG TPA: right-handed parallel beta-helix repeat-containing protein [Acidimicrobiia bacterium]|nr:right-handed parallel beta-helix repeat-containing protein [Acidimicrobiia bacterium]